MELNEIISNTSTEYLLLLFTSLFAFISWIIKSLIEKPLLDSRNTFHKLIDKRVDILSQIKTRLNFIAYFPGKCESQEYKEQLQVILLRDGMIGYLNKSTLEAVFKIAIEPETNENLLLKTITSIDDDLYIQISKIQDETKFFINFSNFNPTKKLIGITILFIQYLTAFVFITTLVITIVYCFLYLGWFLKILLVVLLIGGSFGIGKIINK